MAVALLIALLMDNTMPGTWEERGLHHWNLLGGHRDMSEKAKLAYDLPFGLSEKVRPPSARRTPASVSNSRFLAPTTQGLPRPRATTAA